MAIVSTAEGLTDEQNDTLGGKLLLDRDILGPRRVIERRGRARNEGNGPQNLSYGSLSEGDELPVPLAGAGLVGPLAAAQQVLLDVDARAELDLGSGLHGGGIPLRHPTSHEDVAAVEAVHVGGGDLVLKTLGACVHTSTIVLMEELG